MTFFVAATVALAARYAEQLRHYRAGQPFHFTP
jgi:hypothetical protein